MNFQFILRHRMVSILLVGCLHLATREVHAQVRITEFMAANSSTLNDGNGEFSDWVEIHNAGAESVALAGWHLTDSAADLGRWTFPSVSIDPGGYLVVFASGSQFPIDLTGKLQASFSLRAAGEYLALVQPDGITVASEFSPQFPPQQSDVSFGSDGSSFGYLVEPTPGAANGAISGIPNTVTIAPPGKVFADVVVITLESADLPPGANIRYTLDGSPVTGASAIYSVPLSVTSRTHLRARAFHGPPGPETSAVYLRGAADLAGFTSNLPVIVLDTDAAVPGTNSPTLVGGHALVFDTDPVSGRSAIGGSVDYAGRSGLRVRGRSSAGFPKKQYKFETWDADGAERNASLLGMGGESDWVLSAPYTDKSLMRNALAYSTWKRFGRTSMDTRFVEVFLNQDRDPVLSFADDYVGIYVLTEAITIDGDRVDIKKPEDSTDPDLITGGYLVETGNADSQQFTTTGSGRSVAHRYKDPNISKLNTAQRGWIDATIQHFEEALYAADFRHPSGGEHYSELTDVGSQIDYKIMREWTRNFDGGSQFSYIDRGGNLTMSPIWDYNWALGNVNYAEGGDTPAYRTDGWNRSFTTNINGWCPWWLRFEQDPDWWQGFIDRWTELRESVLSDAEVGSLIEAMATTLEAEATARNFQRWSTLGKFTAISPPGWQQRTTYRSEIDYLRTWLEQRSAWIDEQFPLRPSFLPAGGVVSAAMPARVFEASGGATIYYTTDGSDPRLPGGAVNPAAKTVASSGAAIEDFLVVAGDPVTALRPTSSSPGATAWTTLGFDDEDWVSGNGGVGYENSASDYASFIGTNVGYFPGLQPTSIYARSEFTLVDPSALSDLSLRIRYDDGFIAYLNGTEIARRNAPETVAWNSAATNSHPADEANFPFEIISVTAAIDHLHAGDNVLAIHGLNIGSPNSGNTGSSDSDMLIQADLVGSRLSDGSNNIVLDESSIVTARAFDGSEWGAPGIATFVFGEAAASPENLVVSEIHYHPTDPTAEEMAQNPGISADDFEWIEIHNISTSSVDLSGTSFVEGIIFDFPLQTAIAPGGYLVLAANPMAFALRYPEVAIPLGPMQGSLSSAGERLQIVAADGTSLASFSYRDDWHPLSDGEGFSLNLADELQIPTDYENARAWGASLAQNGTPGAPNGPTLQYSFETWLPQYFTSAEIASDDLTDPHSDGDGDGLSLLAEFALGKNPTSPDGEVLEVINTNAGAGETILRLTFDRARGRVGIETELETSIDMSDWSISSGFNRHVNNRGDGTERVIFEKTFSGTPPTRTFTRLRFLIP